jgi:hypothetical protein
MNIFYLDYDPKTSAEMHIDKHVVKMILEYAQLLSTAHRVLDGILTDGVSQSGRKRKQYVLSDKRDEVLYSATHINHPSAVWVRQHAVNYAYLYNLFIATCDEYTYRYGKVHATDAKLREALKDTPKNILMDNKTRVWHGPTPAMPDECKIVGDHVASYRKYYIDKKSDMAKWTNREPPDWFIKGIQEKDAYLRLPVQKLRELFRRDPKNSGSRRTSKVTVSKV